MSLGWYAHFEVLRRQPLCGHRMDSQDENGNLGREISVQGRFEEKFCDLLKIETEREKALSEY